MRYRRTWPSNELLLSTTAAATLLAPCLASAAESAGGLETVTVTAQRRSESAQDVPATVTSISADTLLEANAQSLKDIGKLTSGFRFDVRSVFYQPTVRGVTTSITLAGSGTNVGTYIDGFYSPDMRATDIMLMNVDSIEVLKGPQGTLFGRNTVGGAILVNSTDPSTEPEAIVEVGYGSYNAQRYQAYATAGLSSKVAVDISGVLSRGDGWITNIAPDSGRNITGDKAGKYENGSVRVGLKADITDNFSILARYTHNSIDDPTPLLFNAYVLNGEPAAASAFTPGAIATTRRGQVSADEPITYTFKGDIFQLTANLDLDFGSITSYTQYRDEGGTNFYSLDYTNIPLFALLLRTASHTFTQELLATSKPGTRLQWTAGAFYFDNFDAFPYNAGSLGANAPYNFLINSGAGSKSIAVYGDVTYEAIDNLFLTLGLRYTNDDVVDAYWQTPAGRTSLPTLSTSRTMPRAAIRYRFNDHSSVYGSYSTGYKAAIYNVGGQSRVPIRPEKLSAFEVGYKYGSSRFSGSLSSYYYDFTDEQLASNVIINGLPQPAITNAGSSRIYGVDTDLTFRVLDDLDVRVGASWSHARYEHFPTAPFFTITPDHLFASAPLPADGKQMFRAPDFTTTIGATYTRPLAAGTLTLSGNFYYTTKFYFDPHEQVPQDAYETLDLRVQWADPSDRYVIALAGKNVTDTKYLASTAPATFGIGAFWGAPATIEASVRVNFF